MQPGELDQRVQIQQQTRTPDGGGGYVEGWSTTATVWAQVRPLSGRERDQAQQQEADVRYRVRIRYRSGVTAAERIVWRGQAMQIRSVLEAGPRPLYLDLDCEAGPAT